MAALLAESRDTSIKVKHLRKEGKIPLALTRRDHSTITLSAPLDGLRNALKHADGHGRFDLQLAGEKPIKVILRSQEVDFIHHRPLSATLQEVTDQDVVRMDVLVVAIGTPEQVTLGEGMLTQPTDYVKLRAKMSNLPEQLEVDVSGMSIGDSIHASQLELPEGVELLSAGDATLFTVQIVKTITEADLTPSIGEEPAEAQSEDLDSTEET